MKKLKILLILFILTFCFNSTSAVEKNMQIENLEKQQENIFKFKENEKNLLKKYIKKESFEDDVEFLENEINIKLKNEIKNLSNPAVICCLYKKNLKYENVSKIIIEINYDSAERIVKNLSISFVFENYYFLKENEENQNVEFEFSKCEKKLLKEYIKKEFFKQELEKIENKISSILNNSFDTGYLNYCEKINNNLLNMTFRVNCCLNLEELNPLNLNEHKNCRFVATRKITTTICCNFNYLNLLY